MLKLISASLVTISVLVSVSSEYKGIPNVSNLKGDEKREIFHYEHTIVIRDSGAADNKARRCEFLDIYDQEEQKEAISQLKNSFKVDIIEVLMDKMMNFIEECDSLDDNGTEDTTQEPESSEEGNSGLHIIIPGTKWCGSGNIAKGYHDLGKMRNIDRCCRSHDYCPVYIRARDEKYNLKNNALYTTSQCRCDEALYDCLKKTNDFTAKLTGNLYFNVLRTKCIAGLPENKNEKMEIVKATRHW